MFAWLAAVNTHKPGQTDAAIGATVTPSLVDLEDVLSDVLALGERLAGRARRLEAGAVTAGALLASQEPIDYRGRTVHHQRNSDGSSAFREANR